MFTPTPNSAPGSLPRVLITGVGGPSGICLLRALVERAVVLLAGDIDAYAAGLYLVAPERRVLLPRGKDPRFADFLLSWCEREGVDVLVPTVDSELIPLAARRGAFERAGVRLVLAPLQTLEVCLDKWALHERCHGQDHGQGHAKDHGQDDGHGHGGVRVPHAVLLNEAFDPAAAPLPAIVKPRVGSGSRGIHRVDCAEEFEPLERDGSLLVQELLPGAEYSLDVLATREGRVVAVVPRERLKIDSGIAVTGRTRHDSGLERIGREVADLIGLTGVANVQVKGDGNGEPGLLEVNPRFPGTMALTVASGPDMPWLCVAEALGEAMPQTMLPFEDIAMVRFFQERFLPFAEIARLREDVVEPVSA
jgi:carbamoyl-phosphate synthase large subunit